MANKFTVFQALSRLSCIANFKCPVCLGDGAHEYFYTHAICCGNYISGECCNHPDIEEEHDWDPCLSCNSTGMLTSKT